MQAHDWQGTRVPTLVIRGSALLGFGIETAWTDLEGAIMQSASKENGSIKIVGPADRPKVIAVLTTAFTTCLLLRWLYPEPERYFRHFAGFLEYYAGDPYIDGSGAYLEDGQKGAIRGVRQVSPRGATLVFHHAGHRSHASRIGPGRPSFPIRPCNPGRGERLGIQRGHQSRVGTSV